jgi:Tol biopolymer transport system component
MRTHARTCVLLGAALGALALAGSPARATYRGANGLLVYQAAPGPHVQLFAIRPDGGGARRLTHFLDSEAINPSWSPDGRRIAFARDFAVGTPSEHLDIYTMKADGSDLQGMGLTGLNGEPTWTPDGRKLLWLRPGGFEVANPDGTGRHTIRIRASEIKSPTFSPDGTRIAFVRSFAKGRKAIYVIRADGSHARRILTPSGGLADKIDWSPDGSRIVFASPAFGQIAKASTNVFTVQPDGRRLVQLTHSTGGAVNNAPDSWSPDGRQIAFVSNRAGVGGYQLYVMRRDGLGVRQVTHGGPESHLAAWGRRPS